MIGIRSSVAADGADEALAMAFARGAHRCLDELDVDSCEHGVEGGSEPAVRVADGNPNRRWRWRNP